VRHAAGMEDARRLLSGIDNPALETVVEDLGHDWRGAGLKGSSVQVASYQNSRIELLAHTTGPSYLVTSKALYPGWKATAKGKPVQLLPTNLAFRGMPVTSGDTSVEMTFRPNRLASSLAVSSVSLLIALFLERALRLQK
jgi:uncharacterized membrane protein YfhO